MFNTAIKNEISIDPSILSLLQEESYTILHGIYTTSPRFIHGWWVNILETSYLVNASTNESLILIQALNIPISPGRHYLNKRGDKLAFTLIFAGIPKSWATFDFIEREGASVKFNVQGIKRNNSGVYRINI